MENSAETGMTAGAERVDACPHLGLENDRSSCYSMPSPRHRCYLWMQMDRIDLSHQSRFCLTESHTVCPWLSISEPWISRRASVLRDGTGDLLSIWTQRAAAMAAVIWAWLLALGAGAVRLTGRLAAAFWRRLRAWAAHGLRALGPALGRAVTGAGRLMLRAGTWVAGAVRSRASPAAPRPSVPSVVQGVTPDSPPADTAPEGAVLSPLDVAPAAALPSQEAGAPLQSVTLTLPSDRVNGLDARATVELPAEAPSALPAEAAALLAQPEEAAPFGVAAGAPSRQEEAAMRGDGDDLSGAQSQPSMVSQALPATPATAPAAGHAASPVRPVQRHDPLRASPSSRDAALPPVGRPRYILEPVWPGPDSWQCDACDQINADSLLVCRGCGRPSPNVETELSTDHDELLAAGLAGLKAGDEDLAYRCFVKACEKNPKNVLAWRWRAKTAPDLEELIGCLEKVVALDPTDAKAKTDLEWSLQRRQHEQAKPVLVTPPPAKPSPWPRLLAGLRGALLQLSAVGAFLVGIALTLSEGIRLVGMPSRPELQQYVALLPSVRVPELGPGMDNLPNWLAWAANLPPFDLGPWLPPFVGLALLHAAFLLIGRAGLPSRIWTALLAALGAWMLAQHGLNPPAATTAALATLTAALALLGGRVKGTGTG